MSIGRGENNVPSESGVGDLGHNILVGLGKVDLRRNERATMVLIKQTSNDYYLSLQKTPDHQNRPHTHKTHANPAERLKAQFDNKKP